jgi:hypothetical protein
MCVCAALCSLRTAQIEVKKHSLYTFLFETQDQKRVSARACGVSASHERATLSCGRVIVNWLFIVGKCKRYVSVDRPPPCAARRPSVIAHALRRWRVPRASTKRCARPDSGFAANAARCLSCAYVRVSLTCARVCVCAQGGADDPATNAGAKSANDLRDLMTSTSACACVCKKLCALTSVCASGRAAERVPAVHRLAAAGVARHIRLAGRHVDRHRRRAPEGVCEHSRRLRCQSIAREVSGCARCRC